MSVTKTYSLHVHCVCTVSSFVWNWVRCLSIWPNFLVKLSIWSSYLAFLISSFVESKEASSAVFLLTSSDWRWSSALSLCVSSSTLAA